MLAFLAVLADPEEHTACGTQCERLTTQSRLLCAELVGIGCDCHGCGASVLFNKNEGPLLGIREDLAEQRRLIYGLAREVYVLLRSQEEVSAGPPAELVAQNDALKAQVREQEGELQRLRTRLRVLETGDYLAPMAAATGMETIAADSVEVVEATANAEAAKAAEAVTGASKDDWRTDEDLMMRIDALGLNSCKFAHVPSSDITSADELRATGLPTLVTPPAGGFRRQTRGGGPLRSKRAFLDAYGDESFTLRDSFLFSHFGDAAGRLPNSSFDWHRAVTMTSFVRSWPYDGVAASHASATATSNDLPNDLPTIPFVFGKTKPSTVDGRETPDKLHDLAALPAWLQRLTQRGSGDFNFQASGALSVGGSGSGISFQ